MNAISFDLSGKIDPKIVEALTAVKSAADSLKIRFFVIGAAALDLILKYCYNMETTRMTMDVDLGVEVADWDQFNQLTNSLVESGRFYRTKQPQRFEFDSLLIDILPFGSITDENNRISWPPKHERLMSMVGFEEAYEHSMTVRFSSDPELEIKEPTLPGLAIMKTISWKEMYPERRKDAEDLLLIMRKYGDAGNTERLFDMEHDLMQEEEFDVVLAGARLLGRDMAGIANPATIAEVKDILEKETREESQYAMVHDMIRGTLNFDDDFDSILLIVKKLKQGFTEAD